MYFPSEGRAESSGNVKMPLLVSASHVEVHDRVGVAFREPFRSMTSA